MLLKGKAPSYGNSYFNKNINGTFIELLAQVTAASRYDTFVDKDGVKYQVPVGKKLIIIGVNGAGGSTNNSSYGVGYGDTSVTSAAGAPTNPINLAPLPFIAYGLSLASGMRNQDCYIEVPAGKYPCIFNGASGTAMSVHAIALLVNA